MINKLNKKTIQNKQHNKGLSMLIHKYQKQLILGLGLLSASLFAASSFAISEQDLNAAKIDELLAALPPSSLDKSDSYLGKVKFAIQKEFRNSDVFRGRTCELQLKLAPNGSLVSATPKNNPINDAALCNAAIEAVKLARMPKPPSAEVYNTFNKSGSTIVFKP